MAASYVGYTFDIHNLRIPYTLCIFFIYLIVVDGIYRILYEEVDESDVDIIKFPSFNGDPSGMEEYR